VVLTKGVVGLRRDEPICKWNVWRRQAGFPPKRLAENIKVKIVIYQVRKQFPNF
jgi:hypothetical protein